ncbi:hypothetical protein CK203_036222 [Vitis vinifera]|uniref:Uncharacterized protein n=1 Tax=Vitis vinifera TaxID=29760 RepID=A0A438IWU4_VITVI|nr:hypothetical protein CK203_036222 [Vitis vinifera]
MAVLLYFEEKVHRKKLLRADAIPLLFPRLLCQILEHLGYPGAPAGPEHPEQPEEPVNIPADTQPPATTVASTSPSYSPTSEPSPSAEPRIAIPIIEYRGLCHTFQALATSQSILTQQIIALRAHQEQILLSMAIPSPPEPSQTPPFVDQPMPPEEPPTGEAEAAEPSSPQHPPATI